MTEIQKQSQFIFIQVSSASSGVCFLTRAADSESVGAASPVGPAQVGALGGGVAGAVLGAAVAGGVVEPATKSNKVRTVSQTVIENNAFLT